MYYPFIHVRDDTWLKAAALYWPRLARLTPPGYPAKDTEVAKALHNELDFLLGIEPPRRQVAAVAKEFLEFLHANQGQLQARYGIDATGNLVKFWHDTRQMLIPDEPWAGSDSSAAVHSERYGGQFHSESYSLRRRLTKDYTEGYGRSLGESYVHYAGAIHESEMTSLLGTKLIGLGLGEKIDDDSGWFSVHPAIASAYTIALIDRVAKDNNLFVVTDQTELYQVHQTALGQEFESTLLKTEVIEEDSWDADHVATMYASIAIQAVVPANMENIPVDKIIKARRKLAAEFDVFREHLGALANEFATLAKVDNPTILRAQLQMLVDRDLRRPTAALERSLRQLGLEPAKAVLGMKTLELPAVAAAATSALGVPVAAGQAGLVAARLVAGGLESRSKRRAAIQGGPAGYLLGLKKHLNPRGVVQRVRQALNRPDGPNQ